MDEQIKNIIVSIREEEYDNLKKEIRKILKYIGLILKDSNISYKYNIDKQIILIEVESDFSKLANKSEMEINRDKKFIENLGYKFCFINKDIFKVLLESHNIKDYNGEELSRFIKEVDYNSGYENIINEDFNRIEKLVLILTLER